MHSFEFKAGESFREFPSGKVAWKSPSNIALIKYWGKREGQLPANPSVSLTLDACATHTTLGFSPRQGNAGGFCVKVLLDGEPREDFVPKIAKFFSRILPYAPYLESFDFVVDTKNSFPHSSGIASSASGMSALALCLLSLEQRLGEAFSEEEFMRKASFYARLGSGSACRSLYGGIAVWGEHIAVENTSDWYAVPYPYAVHPVYEDMHDTVLIIEEGQKSVSSTAGHALMEDNPFACARFEQANANLVRIKPILRSGNFDDFASLVEKEALSLHAMMMLSEPSYLLMKAPTLSAIEKIRDIRKGEKLPVCFTLDAGANLHVLYPHVAAEKAGRFIREELSGLCRDGRYIEDKVGRGPIRMEL